MIISGNDGLLIAYSYLINHCGISKGTVDFGLNEYRKGKSNSWRCFKDGKVVFIYFDTIPAPTRSKLPSESELKAILIGREKDSLAESYYKKLQYAQQNKFLPFQKKYREQYQLPADKALQKGMKAAVWERLLFLCAECGGNKLPNGVGKALYNAYERLYPGSYSCMSAFSRAIKHVKERGVYDYCIDGRHKANQNKPAQKYDKRHVMMLTGLTSTGVKYTAVSILKKMQAACAELGIECPKSTWVKEHVKALKKNPDIYGSRYGASELDKVLPYASLLPAAYADDQWQVDGFTLPFLFQAKGKEGEIRYKRPILIAVFDNHSKKIVGYSIGLSENRETLFEALENAVKTTETLPFELVSDNHSYNSTHEVAYFKEEIKNLGVTWTVDSNPRRKITAERSFKHISEGICKEQHGYLGLSIRAKGKDARPSQEQIDQYLKADHRLSYDEIRALGVLIVETWNKQKAPGRDKSPNELYAASEKPHARPIDHLDRLRLFTKRTTYKVSRYQLAVKTAGRATPYEYQLPVKYARYNQETVIVRYVSLDEIYLFDLKTDLFICTLKEKKKAHGALANQTEDDIHILQQQAALRKSVKTRGRKANEELAQEAYEMEPRIFEVLGGLSTPKDVGQLAREDADLAMAMRAQGIDPEKLATVTKRSAITHPAFKEPKRTRKELSPYEPVNNVMKEINLDEYE